MTAFDYGVALAYLNVIWSSKQAMNIAWIVQGIRDLKTPAPVRSSLDVLYSMMRRDDGEEETQRQSKRSRDDEEEPMTMFERDLKRRALE